MDEGVLVRMFIAYPGVFYSNDGEILRAMQKAAEIGATICMHAENSIAIDVYAEQALKRSETGPIHTTHWCASRCSRARLLTGQSCSPS